MVIGYLLGRDGPEVLLNQVAEEVQEGLLLWGRQMGPERVGKGAGR
jgi:hypothetical protein